MSCELRYLSHETTSVGRQDCRAMLAKNYLEISKAPSYLIPAGQLLTG